MEINTPNQIAETLLDLYRKELAPYHLQPTLENARKFVVRYFRQPGRIYPGHLEAGEIAKALFALADIGPLRY